MKTWKCTVCGYLHEGETPPDECPVCHADRSAFVLVTEPAGSLQNLFGDLLTAAVPHAITAHFPNALTPTLFLVSILAWFSFFASPTETVRLLLLILLVTVPATFATGVLDWKKHYHGEYQPIFRWKLGLGSGLILTTTLATLLQLLTPQWVVSGVGQIVHLALQLLMLLCAAGLGHLGGKLVFVQRQP